MKTKFQMACDKVDGKPCLQCGESIEIPFFLGRRVFCSYECTQTDQSERQNIVGELTDESDENVWNLPKKF